MAQPPDASPENWQPRTDAGARKLIERIDHISAKLNQRIRATDEDVLELRKTMNRRLKQKVGYAALLTILGSAAVFVVSLSVNAANDTRKEMQAARVQVGEDLRQVRTEQAQKIQGIEAKTDGIYQLLVEGKPKAAVREEVKVNLAKPLPEVTDGGFKRDTRKPNQ